MYILVVALLGWTPSWGDGHPQGWVDTACEHEQFNGVKWSPYYSDSENRSVVVERRGDTVRIQLWSNKPREIVAEATVRCNDV